MYSTVRSFHLVLAPSAPTLLLFRAPPGPRGSFNYSTVTPSVAPRPLARGPAEQAERRPRKRCPTQVFHSDAFMAPILCRVVAFTQQRDWMASA